MSDHEVRLFQSIGLSEGKAKETAKNVTLSKTLTWIVSEVESNHVILIISVIVRQANCVEKMSVNKLGTCCIILQPGLKALKRTLSY